METVRCARPRVYTNRGTREYLKIFVLGFCFRYLVSAAKSLPRARARVLRTHDDNRLKAVYKTDLEKRRKNSRLAFRREH